MRDKNPRAKVLMFAYLYYAYSLFERFAVFLTRQGIDSSRILSRLIFHLTLETTKLVKLISETQSILARNVFRLVLF